MASQALIVYSQCQLTASLNAESRVFDLDGKLIRIKQEWKPDGRGGTSIGFGASIYDCSFVLLDYLKNNLTLIEKKSVLEIGCGTGFTSIAVAVLGAGLTVVTDGDQSSVALTNENIQNNSALIGKNLIVAQKLYWGDSADSIAVKKIIADWNSLNKSSSNSNHHSTASLEHSDNNGCVVTSDSGYEYPDVLIASDIAAVPYAAAYHALIDCLTTMCGPKTTVIIAYQRRHATEEDFFALLRERFSVERLPRSTIHSDFRAMPIFLFKCRIKREDTDSGSDSRATTES